MSVPLLDDVVVAVHPFVTGLAAWLAPVGGTTAAVVVCTVALRLLVLPLTLAAVRGERARAALAPRVAALRRAHGRDPAAMARALAALHRDAGVPASAGMLPLLAQAPVFLLWYRVLTTPRVDGAGNALLSDTLFGAPLSAHLAAAPGVFVPLLLAVAGLGVLAVRRARRVAAATGAPPLRGPLAAVPLLPVVAVPVLPLGAVVYLVTTLAWTAAENAVLRRGLPARTPRGGGAG